MDFIDKLEKAITKNNSLLCVGLDPDPERFKKNQSQFLFSKNIIDQTAKHVCCFKSQIAFFSAYGPAGIRDLKKTITYIKTNYPQIPVILDAKRADIGSTSQMYAREVFDFFAADAATVNPYLGFDSLEPFLIYQDKAIIVLCKTSNPGATDFQDLKVNGEPLYLKVAKKVVKWNQKYQNLLMVVGATWPIELKNVRKIAPKMTFLIPGIGSQGGDLRNTLTAGLRKDGRGLIISASRSIIYAQDPQKEAKNLQDEINRYR